jgi:hypothetical protein
MVQLSPQSRIFVAIEPVDFRKGIDGCVFHGKVATYSTAKLPLIPWQACHLFHTKVATDSTAKLPPIP